jgi:serine protease Do
MTLRTLVAAFIFGILPASASAQISSNAKVLAPFRSVVAKANESTVRVRCDDKECALGTVVFADGFILTKASELKGTISVRLFDGTEYAATIVGRDKDTDLALLHVDAKDLKPVSFSDSAKVPAGNWLAAASPTSDPIGVGIVSAMTRKLTGLDRSVYNHNKGYLGILLDEEDAKDKDKDVKIGAKVKEVTKNGAAKKAGMKENDVIIAVEGVKVAGRVALQEALENSRPGEAVTVTILRENEDKNLEEKKLKVTLTGEINPKGRGDIQNAMGSELSGRRTGFPAILQTDMVLEPKNCGGPIVDLDGKVLGISIARAGRVETWVLPSENIRPLLVDLKSGKYAPGSSSIKSEK